MRMRSRRLCPLAASRGACQGEPARYPRFPPPSDHGGNPFFVPARVALRVRASFVSGETVPATRSGAGCSAFARPNQRVKLASWSPISPAGPNLAVEEILGPLQTGQVDKPGRSAACLEVANDSVVFPPILPRLAFWARFFSPESVPRRECTNRVPQPTHQHGHRPGAAWLGTKCPTLAQMPRGGFLELMAPLRPPKGRQRLWVLARRGGRATCRRLRYASSLP